MKLKELGEFGFIDLIKNRCLVNGEMVIKAIGDDCAVYDGKKGKVFLLTTDLMIENVHFVYNKISPFDLGYKLLAVNLSDIAAMGGEPKNAFLSLAVPKKISVSFLEKLYEGILSLARMYGVNVLGGDTTSSKNDLVLNIALTGEIEQGKVLYRSGACEADKIIVSGYLGESSAGLNILLNENKLKKDFLKPLLKAHNKPEIFVHEGAFLAETGFVTSCIDISDGLSSDLGHLCKQSECGAVLFEEQLPVSKALKEWCDFSGKNSLEFVLSGGEDYKLLFTVQNEKYEELKKSYQQKFGKNLFCIGHIIQEQKVIIKDRFGKSKTLLPSGWNHFSEA